MKIEVIEPHGFCAGVTGALKKALALPGGAYCLHELVHNELVVKALEQRGMKFVDSLDEVPAGATVLFSAHGVAPSVQRAALDRGLEVVDATCPFVARVHKAARSFAERGLPVVVIGKASHAEVAGIVGEVEDAGGLAYVYPDLPETDMIGVVSQTTMNADDVAMTVDGLKGRFKVDTMAEVCGATRERQRAVKAFAGDALLVLGSASSSNTRRLCEVAPCRAMRAGTMEELEALDLSGVHTLGVTSGASTPEEFFAKAIRHLKDREGNT
jgi:4-hydroxy-3-methylbut-2-enyl diphosphate reductase